MKTLRMIRSIGTIVVGICVASSALAVDAKNCKTNAKSLPKCPPEEIKPPCPTPEKPTEPTPAPTIPNFKFDAAHEIKMKTATETEDGIQKIKLTLAGGQAGKELKVKFASLLPGGSALELPKSLYPVMAVKEKDDAEEYLTDGYTVTYSTGKAKTVDDWNLNDVKEITVKYEDIFKDVKGDLESLFNSGKLKAGQETELLLDFFVARKWAFPTAVGDSKNRVKIKIEK